MKMSYDNPTEEEECIIFHQWLELKKIPHHHIANESRSGKYGAIRGAKLKKMGQSKGFPDYAIVLPDWRTEVMARILGTMAPLNKLVFIEMKRRRGGVLSPEQKGWLDVLNSCGIESVVCRGFEEAKVFIEKYIGGAK